MAGLSNTPDNTPDPRELSEQEWIDNPPESDSFEEKNPEKTPEPTRREIDDYIDIVLEDYNFPGLDGQHARAVRNQIARSAFQNSLSNREILTLVEEVDGLLESNTREKPLEHPFDSFLGRAEYTVREIAADPGHLDRITDVDLVLNDIPILASDIKSRRSQDA